jgi:hypothetical protein
MLFDLKRLDWYASAAVPAKITDARVTVLMLNRLIVMMFGSLFVWLLYFCGDNQGYDRMNYLRMCVGLAAQ